MYSWGHNRRGQCGDGTLKDLLMPKQVDFFKNYGVDTNECGNRHSYVKTKCGKLRHKYKALLFAVIYG